MGKLALGCGFLHPSTMDARLLKALNTARFVWASDAMPPKLQLNYGTAKIEYQENRNSAATIFRRVSGFSKHVAENQLETGKVSIGQTLEKQRKTTPGPNIARQPSKFRPPAFGKIHPNRTLIQGHVDELLAGFGRSRCSHGIVPNSRTDSQAPGRQNSASVMKRMS